MRESHIEKYLKGKVDFNPWDVSQYHNYMFKTLNTTYIVDGNGDITGPGVENKKVQMIAGMEAKKFIERYHELKLQEGCLYKPNRRDIMKMVLDHGKPIKKRMLMVILLDPEDIKPGDIPGIITSNIDYLEPLPDNYEKPNDFN